MAQSFVRRDSHNLPILLRNANVVTKGRLMNSHLTSSWQTMPVHELANRLLWLSMSRCLQCGPQRELSDPRDTHRHTAGDCAPCIQACWRTIRLLEGRIACGALHRNTRLAGLSISPDDPIRRHAARPARWCAAFLRSLIDTLLDLFGMPRTSARLARTEPDLAPSTHQTTVNPGVRKDHHAISH